MASLRPPSRCRPSWPSIRRRCPPRTRTPLRRRRSGDSKGFDENSLGELEFTEVQRWMTFFDFLTFFLKDLLSDHLWIRLVVKQLVCPVQFFFEIPVGSGRPRWKWRWSGWIREGLLAARWRSGWRHGCFDRLEGRAAGRQGASACDFRLVSQVQLVYLSLTRPILLRHQFLLYKFVRF